MADVLVWSCFKGESSLNSPFTFLNGYTCCCDLQHIPFPICRLRHILLQSEEELLRKENTELVSEGASVKTKKTIGKIKIQGSYLHGSCRKMHLSN